MIELFPDQERSVAGLRRSIRTQKTALSTAISTLLVSPTGSGKTVMFSYLTSKLVGAGLRVMLLAHREELLEQISNTLKKFNVPHGVIGKGDYYDPRLLAHVAGVFTVVKRLAHFAVPDYLIVDEAHHGAEGSTWDKVIAYYRALNPALVVIGVTATPERLDGSGLGRTFRDMVLGPTTRELIDLKRLSTYKLYLPAAGGMVDLSGVRKRAGEYAKEESTARTDKPTITGSAVAQYRKHCDGAPAVVFCGSREHAEHVAEHFRSEGYRAASIDGSMSKDDRRERNRDFARNVLQVLTSCDLISEGYDVPGIVAAILLRPTQSLGLYLQQVGRALRIAPGKDRAIILDHVGNSMMPLPGGGYTLNHGFPDDEREWTLDGVKRSKREVDPDDVATKQCPKCREWNRGLAQVCRECGHAFVVRSRKIEEREGELEEADVDALRQEARAQQAAARTAEGLQALGMNAGRAGHIMEARAEKAALRQKALDLSWELARAKPGTPRMTQTFVYALKPKQLRELIAGFELEIAALAPADDEAAA